MHNHKNQELKYIGEPDVKIDVNQIPEYQRRQLAELALEVTREVFSRPGEEERYQEWLKKRQQEKK